jgi:parallel beta-helix repeat protein
MNTKLNLLAAGMFLAASSNALASTTLYVDVKSASPMPPFLTWATAATNIQDAVDAAVSGDEIVVTNGVYATGGREVSGTGTNRVAVDKPIVLRSINGPQLTTIQGAPAPDGGTGAGSIRCVYLTNGAILAGFTLTKGFAANSGGVWCESLSAVVSNCTLTGNSAYFSGGGASGGTLNYCTLNGNSGGGAYQCTLNNCTITGNSGSGASGCTLNYCTLTGNSDSGASGCTLNYCALTGNHGLYTAGGASGCTLNNCTLAGNWADYYGGGAYQCTLNNCIVTGNWVWDTHPNSNGGGAYDCTLNNCTVTGNSAVGQGGGAYGGTQNNCIVYYNTATWGANVGGTGILNNCCSPDIAGVGGNITNAPLFVDYANGNLRLQPNSPCINAGNNSYVIGTTDPDGNPRILGGTVDIGAYEFQGAGPSSVGIAATSTNVATGVSVGFTALSVWPITASLWDFGDGIVVSNLLYTSHAWATPGDYAVALWACTESHPEGLSATQLVHVVAQPVHYVAASSTNPLAPYLSWATAATNLQDAVDQAYAGGVILVSNGVYATGGRAVSGTMTNRVAVYKPVAVWSVNGPQFTTIQGRQVPGTTNGDGAVRCVYLTNGASLSGFTLTKGATRSAGDSAREQSGGGLWCESATAVVSNCVVTGNTAYYNGGGGYAGTLNNCTLTRNTAYQDGGGAAGGMLNQCTLSNNLARDSGGGAYQSTLSNCTLTANATSNGYGNNYGGGACDCTLNNCTLTGNSAFLAGGACYGGTLNNCTLTGNSAGSAGGGACQNTLNNCKLTGNSAGAGGGACYGTLNNCTLTGNGGAYSGNGAYECTLENCIIYYNAWNDHCDYCTLDYCCTPALPATGAGNITNAPLFVNQAGGNLRLQSNSPCINAGTNAYVVGSTDLDGRPRIVGGTVDIGAYEFQPGASGQFIGWLQQYRLPTDGSADFTDPDRDGMNNWQEWRCGTCPTSSLSVLQVLSVTNAVSGVTVSWQSVAGVNYSLERSTDLSATPPFTLLATNLPGQTGTTTYADTNAVGTGPFFYRVGVSSQ